MDLEQRLEEVLERDISVVSEPRKWMIIGRQVPTDHGGRIDLLALDESATLIVLELKRERSDREVVSQALDYGAWASELSFAAIADIYSAHEQKAGRAGGPPLADAFRAYFGRPFPDELDGTHEMVIVASDLHPESERVARYLRDNFSVPISAVFFSIFRDGGQEFLSRTWAVEPTPVDVPTRRAGKWNGEYYASFGYPRAIVEAGFKYGFLVAGGGTWFTKSMDMLDPDDRVWVHLGSGNGFGGVARVVESRVPIDDFTVTVAGVEKRLIDVVPSAEWRLAADDVDTATFAVRLEWLHTVPYEKAVWEKGFFANQNTVARPTTEKWEYTVKRLTDLWGVE